MTSKKPRNTPVRRFLRRGEVAITVRDTVTGRACASVLVIGAAGVALLMDRGVTDTLAVSTRGVAVTVAVGVVTAVAVAVVVTVAVETCELSRVLTTELLLRGAC